MMERKTENPESAKVQSKKKCDGSIKALRSRGGGPRSGDTEREERGGVGLSCHHMTPRNRRVAAEEEQFSSEVENEGPAADKARTSSSSRIVFLTSEEADVKTN
ncbi:unnamed protein product [Gadus morhua 'NCC']